MPFLNFLNTSPTYQPSWYSFSTRVSGLLSLLTLLKTPLVFSMEPCWKQSVSSVHWNLAPSPILVDTLEDSIGLFYGALLEAVRQLCALELGAVSPPEVESLALHNIPHHPTMVGVAVVPVVGAPALPQAALPGPHVGVTVRPGERPKPLLQALLPAPLVEPPIYEVVGAVAIRLATRPGPDVPR